jgi:hypothetical protein
LGSIAVDVHAQSRQDLSQAKIKEELAYFHSTSGRQLDGSEAERKRLDEERRRREQAKRQALTGNTHEAQKRLATLTSASSSKDARIRPKVSGTNMSMKVPPKPLSSTLFEQVNHDPCTLSAQPGLKLKLLVLVCRQRSQWSSRMRKT